MLDDLGGNHKLLQLYEVWLKFVNVSREQYFLSMIDVICNGKLVSQKLVDPL